MITNPELKSGVTGMAEVRFGGKVAIGIVSRRDTKEICGISFAELKEQHAPGDSLNDDDMNYGTQVTLFFDSMESVRAVSEALAQVERAMKDDSFASIVATSSEQDALLSQKIVDCDLSVRTISICKANGIETLGDLVKLQRSDWLKFRNGGKKSFAELEDFLTAHGLTWGIEV